MKEKLKIFTTFSGIGCQEKGFIDSNLFDIEVVATSDVDKDAIVSYAAIHCGLTQKMIEEYSDYPNKDDMVDELKRKNIGYDFIKNKAYDWDKLAKRKGKNIEKYWLSLKLANNLGDICKVKTIPECDILTFSFPCQSISIAGRQEGMIKGETRSGLVYEIVRLVENAKAENKLPKYMMLENVSALVSKKFIEDFENLNKFFDDMGFNTYWSLINGKDCGIPQNRLRCFAVYIRKDIDQNTFKFPKPFDNGVRLKDILENEVDEKYYLPDDKVAKFLENLQDVNHKVTTRKSIEPNNVKQVGNIVNTGNWDNPQRGRIYSTKGCSPTLNTCSGGGLEPKILQVGKLNFSQDGVVVLDEGVSPTHTAGHGNTPKIIQMGNVNPSGNGMNGNVFSDEGLAPTLTTNKGEGNKIFLEKLIRIRKLIPLETFRLMGLTDKDFYAAEAIGISNSQLYKQAGNGIITNCCELLAEHLYKAQYDKTYICTDERYQENFTQPQEE